jgi:hypothetical protein
VRYPRDGRVSQRSGSPRKRPSRAHGADAWRDTVRTPDLLSCPTVGRGDCERVYGGTSDEPKIQALQSTLPGAPGHARGMTSGSWSRGKTRALNEARLELLVGVPAAVRMSGVARAQHNRDAWLLSVINPLLDGGLENRQWVCHLRVRFGDATKTAALGTPIVRQGSLPRRI